MYDSTDSTRKFPARISGLAKSARELVKTRSHELSSPGTERGSVTLLKVSHLVARRFIAASSRVESMPSSTPIMVRKAIGNIPIVCTRVSPPRPYMLKPSSERSCLVTSPLLPNSRMSERVREKGGEMTGSVAMAEKNLLPRIPVLDMTNANRKPTAVDAVAV